jgi:hypothetical protein
MTSDIVRMIIFIREALRLEFEMPVSAIAYLDFGYPWWLTYGHLPILALTASLLLLGYARKWSRWPMLLLSAVAL